MYPFFWIGSNMHCFFFKFFLCPTCSTWRPSSNKNSNGQIRNRTLVVEKSLQKFGQKNTQTFSPSQSQMGISQGRHSWFQSKLSLWILIAFLKKNGTCNFWIEFIIITLMIQVLDSLSTYFEIVSYLVLSLTAAWAGHWLLGRSK